jgi:hypothetical protein
MPFDQFLTKDSIKHTGAIYKSPLKEQTKSDEIMLNFK